MEGRLEIRKSGAHIDGGSFSGQLRSSEERESDGASSSMPAAISSSATRSERLRAKIEGGSDNRKIDGGTSYEQPKTNNENKGDGVSSSMPGSFSSSATPDDERWRAKMEGRLGIRKSGAHIDGGSFSGQLRSSEERESDGASSSMPAAISSSAIPDDERWRAKMEGRLEVTNSSAHIDGGSFSGQLRAREEGSGDGVSSSRSGLDQSFTTEPSEDLRATREERFADSYTSDSVLLADGIPYSSVNEIASPGDFELLPDDDTLEAAVAAVDTELLPELDIFDNDVAVEAELALDEYIVDALQVEPLMDDKVVDSKHKRRVYGAIGLAIAAAGVGVGIFIGTYSSGTGEVCKYFGMWEEEGGVIMHKERDSIAVDLSQDPAGIMELFYSFGSDLCLSDSGRRIAVSAKFGDAVSVYELAKKDDNVETWEKLGEDLKNNDPLVFSRYSVRAEHWIEAGVVLSGHGDRVAVGFPYNSNNGTAWGGSIEVHEYDSQGWVPLGEKFFGKKRKGLMGNRETFDLSQNGSIIAIGEPHFKNVGRVRVFNLIKNSWNLLGPILYGQNKNDLFGSALSLSANGTVLAIGSLGAVGDMGLVITYGFREEDNNWIQVGQNITSEGFCHFGHPIELSADGTRLAVMSSHFVGNDTFAEDNSCVEFNSTSVVEDGAIRVYHLINGNWTQTSPLFELRLKFGFTHFSLSGDGNTLVAGAPKKSTNVYESGAARVYKFSCGNWTQMVQDINGTDTGSWTGSSVGLSHDGEFLAVGSPYDWGLPSDLGGQVRVYSQPTR